MRHARQVAVESVVALGTRVGVGVPDEDRRAALAILREAPTLRRARYPVRPAGRLAKDPR